VALKSSNGNNQKLRRLNSERDPWPLLEVAFEEFVQNCRRKRAATRASGEDETEAILELMRAMLEFDPRSGLR
jgi:hypothetical protein